MARQAWWFGRQRASDKHRDPTQGEYFGTSADSLIRESIQNSLDAGIGSEPVSVRIHVSHGGIPVADTGSLFDGLAPHLDAAAEFARVASPMPRMCRYLTIEDFGTTGLRGNPDECFDPQIGANFYHFFRAEGRSAKSTGGRGSWGYGKYTFVKASTANTFFGVTVPDDGNRASALGQAVLTNHQIDGEHFEPDGWWGRELDDPNHGRYVTSYSLDEDAYRELTETFGIVRTDEPGLSVVVPFLDAEITADSVVEAVLGNYLPSILFGHLDVVVTSDSSDAVTITHQSVAKLVRSKTSLRSVAWLLEMAGHLHNGERPDLTLTNRATSSSWDDYELDEGDAAQIVEWLEEERIFSVRVPLVVSPKSEIDPLESHLDACFIPAGGERSRPSFFRQGVLVADVTKQTSARARSMVWIEDEPLATMLGLAETPAHNNWESTNDRFRGQYHQGRNWISFVRRAPLKVLDLAVAGRPSDDRRALASFFPTASTTSGRSRMGAGRPSDEGRSTRPEISFDPETKPVRIQPIRSNGFRVHLTDEIAVGDLVDVVVAYDVLNGNPFTKWSPLDFDVADLSLEAVGVEVVECVGQRIRLKVERQDAELDVWGFDRWLDVIVRCEAVV